MSSNEIVVQAEPVTGLVSELASLSSGGNAGIMSTVALNSHADRIKVLSALSNSKSIADALGATIAVTDVIVQAVDMVNEQTGEMRTVPRVVFIDDKGNAHHATSGPLYRDVKNLLAIAPHSEWTEPVKVKVTQEGSGTGKYFTLNYV
jgi:hypothetical protein